MNNSFVQHKENDVVYLTSDILSHNKTAHFFSTKLGGESSGVYASMNLGIYTNDEPDVIVENFVRIAEATGVGLEEIVYMNQVHGDRILVVEEQNFEEIAGSDADALITRSSKIAIGVFTADCVPILLHDASSGVIAAVHAGWKGTKLEIVRKTIEVMCNELGANVKDIRAAIGPSIGSCCYEVEDETAVHFSCKQKQKPEGKWHIDLAQENKSQMISSRLLEENIDVCGMCTKCGDSLFYSYRRDNAETGRMGAFIQLI